MLLTRIGNCTNIYTYEFYKTWGVEMLKMEIEILREQLNHHIQYGSSYEQIYDVSIQLDQLITAFYQNQNKKIIV